MSKMNTSSFVSLPITRPPPGVLWTGEVWDFLSFTERHPTILYNILLFGLTSALGQVNLKCLHCWPCVCV